MPWRYQTWRYLISYLQYKDHFFRTIWHIHFINPVKLILLLVTYELTPPSHFTVGAHSVFSTTGKFSSDDSDNKTYNWRELKWTRHSSWYWTLSFYHQHSNEASALFLDCYIFHLDIHTIFRYSDLMIHASGSEFAALYTMTVTHTPYHFAKTLIFYALFASPKKLR